MNYKEQIQAWLDTEPAQRGLELGAKLMLQGNRNRILHENVIRKSNFEKIEYELQKIMGDEFRNCNEPIVQEMTLQVATNEATQKEVVNGKRADHDTLPENIQEAYQKNLEIYPRMRSLHERLKVLNETATACDRYPFLKELLELDVELRANWEAYDSYDAANPVAQELIKEVITVDPKRISANRTYLSRAKANLEKSKDVEKTKAILAEMQIRIDEVLSVGETFSAEQKAEFEKNGLNVALNVQ
jgi:hypothetical protein